MARRHVFAAPSSFFGTPSSFRVAVAAAVMFGSLASIRPVAAQAGTASATMLVTATVQSFCTITTTPLSFGTYTQTALAAASSVTVTCTSGTTYNVGLDIGGGTGASVTARKMTYATTNTLNYGLYSDSAHSVVWGPTIGTNTVAGTATGSAQTLPIYGQIPANQFVAPGSYTDTVTATVSY